MAKKKSTRKFDSKDREDAILANIEAAKQSLNKQFGDNAIRQLSDETISSSIGSQISTGSLALDVAIGALKRNEDGSWSRGFPIQAACCTVLHTPGTSRHVRAPLIAILTQACIEPDFNGRADHGIWLRQAATGCRCEQYAGALDWCLL